jgi:hypothetical protein
MPRRRTSNRPIRRRIKLATQQDVQTELGRVYKAVDAGTMSPAEGTRRVFILDKLRASGLPDARATSAGCYVPPVIQILSVPSNHFLSAEQIEAVNRGEPFINIAECTPIRLEHDEPALLEHTPHAEPDAQHEEPAVSGPWRDDFANMTLAELKRRAGVDVD